MDCPTKAALVAASLCASEVVSSALASIGLVCVRRESINMDKHIDGRFERLEKALSNLIDSVTKYHPSTIQAEELQAADNELSKGLDEGMSRWLFQRSRSNG